MTPRQIGYALQDSFNKVFMDSEKAGRVLEIGLNLFIILFIMVSAIMILSEFKSYFPEPKPKEEPQIPDDLILFSDCNICKGKGYVEHEGKVLRCHFCASIFHQSQHYKAKNGK